MFIGVLKLLDLRKGFGAVVGDCSAAPILKIQGLQSLVSILPQSKSLDGVISGGVVKGLLHETPQTLAVLGKTGPFVWGQPVEPYLNRLRLEICIRWFLSQISEEIVNREPPGANGVGALIVECLEPLFIAFH